MKFAIRLFICLFLAAAVSPACKNTSVKFPVVTPEEVAAKFFRLLADGGRLSNQEAHKMVSTKYGDVSPDNFRRMTENFQSTTSKIKVVQATLPKDVNKHGDWVAMVKLEVKTPSRFGDDFITSSQINLILDEESHEWQIDYNAETIDESSFMKAPQEANGTELAK